MKLAELRSILDRDIPKDAEVHIADCSEEATPCVLVGAAYGMGELHLFCAHRESQYPDDCRIISYVEQAAREIAAAGHLSLEDARATVLDAVDVFKLDTSQRIQWDVAHATVGEAGSNVPE